ncbi:MAG TPA: ThuA domain-containing protein [Armatimonadota bacterium]|nr:ThuA domain-containing protein [Armatimonadota bacterium]HQK92221.1 ThuA domain-containing protein [Armatimonadota bacterium]
MPALKTAVLTGRHPFNVIGFHELFRRWPGVEPYIQHMVDETYGMNSPGPDSKVLVTTTHQPSMTALAWTRTFKKAPVFCLESGHDNQTWVDANFRRLMTQGTHWTAGREIA